MTLDLRPPIAPMEALPVDAIPTGPEWQYEPKWDGFRCLVFRDGDSVTLQSKAGKPLTQSNTRTKVADFAPAGAAAAAGVRVAVRDIDGDGTLDLLTASGELVSAFQGGIGLPATGLPPLLFAFDPDPTAAGSVWIG